MKRLFSIFVLAVIAFAACTTDVTEDVAVKLLETLTVSFEESSRIQLNEEQKTVWTAGDLVSVFYRSDANQQWKFNGQTGATTAELTKVTKPEATNTLSKVVTIYPYNENYTIDAECKVTATLPAEQEYLADSFGVGSSIMVAESESNNAQLRNAMGWLRLHLTGDGEVVKSITVKGNNSEQVAGQVTINPYDATITLAESSTATTVTLNCTDGVTLSSEETAFYIALPPQKFEGGITAEINCNDGSKMVKSTSNSVTIKRNTILPMEELSYQDNTRIYYTATEKIVPNNTDVFGANIVSNEWDETTGKGIITFDAPVTSIGNSAFYKCSSLTSVTIPDSVTTIGSSAFGHCSSLTSVTIPNSVTEIGSNAFYGCSSLTSVIIPNSVSSIGDYAFSYCSSLTTVTIPDSVTEIGSYAFRGCSSLTSVTIPDSVTVIGSYTFYYCSSLTSVTIPNSVTEIGSYAFEYCSSLTSVTIPDSVTTLGDNPFRRCSKLTEFNGKFASADKRCLIVDGVLNSFAPAGLTEYTIPDSVTEIGSQTFYKCSSLTSVTIPNSVTTIGDWAFRDCSSLTSVTIPDSVIEIGSDAFSGCSSLPSVTIPNSVTEIGYSAFFGCSSLASVTIPNSVTTLGTNPFEGCSKLTEFNGKFASADKRCLIVDGFLNSFAIGCGLTEYTIPDSVTKIGSSAFSYCRSLTSVTIPNSVTEIGYMAFAYCSSLTSVTIPDSVTYIGSSAFEYCSSLKSVYCNAAYPPTLESSTFGNTALENIYVYAESVDTYKAKWSDYANKIVSNNKSNSDSITFTYTSTDGKAINKSNLNLVVKRNSYTNGVGTLVVYGTAIPDKAFYHCTTLKTITIPNRVTVIGDWAFEYCSSLTSVTIPNSVTEIGMYAFYGCRSLTSVIIPDSVTEIGMYAFYGCRSLTSVTIGNRVTTIGWSAFEYCSSLTSVTIPNSVTEIGGYAFEYCSSLTSVTIPNSVTKIEDSAFYYCSSLTSVTIPDSVTEIGSRAFYGCNSLTSVTIPDSVTEIGSRAFSDCSSLTSVTIPDSVTTLGDNPFEGCSKLTEFNGKFASADKRCLIVDGVLNSFAPAGLTEYTIPDSVTEIGSRAFSDWSSLTSVTIPDSVTEIGSSAFEYCSLTSVTIGNSVTTIGGGAFKDCTNLKEVFCKPTTPPTLDSKVFYNHATDRKIYVPASDDDSIINAYKAAAGWSEYAADIEEYDFTE